MRVSVLGTGQMGLPIARNVLSSGHELFAWNRTRDRAMPLAGDGAHVADSIAAAVGKAEVVITMLSDDRAVEQTVLGHDGLAQHLPGEAIHVSMSTISPALSRRLAQLHASRDQRYIAAPVFGRPDAAATKKLWIVAAGPHETVERCRTLFEGLSQGIFEVGTDPSAANVVKLAGNFCIASMIETLGEAFALVQKNDVDPAQFLEIANSLFRSPMYQNYGGQIVKQSCAPGFKLVLGLKDVRLVLAAADQSAVPMPFGSALHDQLMTAAARGHGDSDWSALGAFIAENAGLGGA